MVDYYALPATEPGGWPGRATASTAQFDQKSSIVQTACSLSFANAAEDISVSKRFIPFVVMHEFEALLFSDCVEFARAIGHPDLSAKFLDIRQQFASPEHINDAQETAPSKRIALLFARYEKPLNGVIAANRIGLKVIRQECPLFGRWLGIALNADSTSSRLFLLESIPAQAPSAE